MGCLYRHLVHPDVKNLAFVGSMVGGEIVKIELEIFALLAVPVPPPRPSWSEKPGIRGLNGGCKKKKNWCFLHSS